MDFKIQVRELGIKLDSKSILKDINVKIAKNEIFTIIGSSGAGKSVFLRCLNRLMEPDNGNILLDGESILDIDPRRLRKKVGMVFQIPVIFKGSVSNNVLAGPSIWKNELGNRERISIVKKALESIDLNAELAGKNAEKLSVGQQQRVCIARTIANGPDVILMDEPTSSLDPKTTRNIEKLIEKLNHELGITFVIITHNMEQARRIGDTTMLLKDGKLENLGKTEIFFREGNSHLNELMGEN